ncbi:alpha/beta hydrolase [Patescibacteria group bacterium]
MARTKLTYKKTYFFQKAKLSYEVLGKGKSVILLHGALTNWTATKFKKSLAKSYRVYVPDLPGFGASDAIFSKKHNIDLFCQAFTVFLNKTGLKHTPIIALSLGSLVAIKTAAKKQTMGKLVLVGMPVKIKEWKFFWLSLLPLFIKRAVVNTTWGKKYFVIPILRENIGPTDKQTNKKLIKLLKSTATQAMIDTNYLREVNTKLPKIIKQVNNKMVFVYGEKDKQKKLSQHIVKKYIEIPHSEHNIFRSSPQQSLKIIKKLI